MINNNNNSNSNSNSNSNNNNNSNSNSNSNNNNSLYRSLLGDIRRTKGYTAWVWPNQLPSSNPRISSPATPWLHRIWSVKLTAVLVLSQTLMDAHHWPYTIQQALGLALDLLRLEKEINHMGLEKPCWAIGCQAPYLVNIVSGTAKMILDPIGCWSITYHSCITYEDLALILVNYNSPSWTKSFSDEIAQHTKVHINGNCPKSANQIKSVYISHWPLRILPFSLAP